MQFKVIGVGITIHTMRDDPRYNYPCEFEVLFDQPEGVDGWPELRGFVFAPSDETMTIAQIRRAAAIRIVEAFRSAADQIETEYS